MDAWLFHCPIWHLYVLNHCCMASHKESGVKREWRWNVFWFLTIRSSFKKQKDSSNRIRIKNNLRIPVLQECFYPFYSESPPGSQTYHPWLKRASLCGIGAHPGFMSWSQCLHVQPAHLCLLCRVWVILFRLYFGYIWGQLLSPHFPPAMKKKWWEEIEGRMKAADEGRERET